MLRDMLWISVGAVLGANLRYVVYRLGAVIAPAATFPYPTLVINIVGSFLLAVFAFLVADRALADPKWRLLFAIGFCGSFTTFSTFALESYRLYATGRTGLLALNILVSNAACILAVFAGAALERTL